MSIPTSPAIPATPATRVRGLDDPSFEHDACGIGFVADAGGASAERVLPLALAGLAALRHRGAVAADGASSDGAGLMLPLSASVLERLGAEAARRPGVVMAFLPGGAAARRRARATIVESLAAERLAVTAWRPVPVDPSALGEVAARSRPSIEQAIVDRPAGLADRRFEASLAVARRRAERRAREDRLDLSIPSASCRTIVYKGLVAGDRLAAFYPDLAGPLVVATALFHQRFATNTQPQWNLAQPFRRIAHNGEINTVRANRVQVRGRLADPVRGDVARRLVAAGPILSPGGSDSLALDELLEALELTGWPSEAALLAAIPEALPMRRSGHPLATAFADRIAGFLAPWDGPAAIVFGDGRRVGALADRNGLRPVAFAVTADRLVACASEAGAVPLAAAETVRRGRLGPGELLLVDTDRGWVFEDGEAKTEVLRRTWTPSLEPAGFRDRGHGRASAATPPAVRFVAGLDAERARLSIRTLALEAHEPLWSMGDDTPLPGLGRIDRPVTDQLRQSFAQVTNPPIDPDRERAVLDLSIELGRRPPLLGGLPRPESRSTIRLDRPIVADLDGLLDRLARIGPVRRLDATWPAAEGPGGLANAIDRLAGEAEAAARAGAVAVLVSDAALSLDRLPVPAVLAVGAVHAALTDAGLRGRTDVVADTADVLDVHACAMALAAGASALHPRLAVELAAELAGSRGAESLTAIETVERLLDGFAAGLRKTLARMGIGTAASYVGGNLVETVELAPEVIERCLPAVAAWPGRLGFADLAARQLRRLGAARRLEEGRPPAGREPTPSPATSPSPAAREPRLPDEGLARYRGDGERHLWAPASVGAAQALVADGLAAPGQDGLTGDRLAAYRAAITGEASVVRDHLRIRRPRGRPAIAIEQVEPASSIIRRFTAAAMSVGALSPEAHQAITIGMQRAGGSANTGEGGEDPAWYRPTATGERHDARIKQVASARFGVTATYLARADQLEIKIAQGSKPGEGGQLPGRKATAHIAALRRAQPGQTLISPPPHHDIYSIEDLAQLITDLRAINPRARIGVKLVAARGIGTIAAGVAKAGADVIHVGGHAGGTGASPLASIKHVGAPWELGLAEVHQVLLRNGLRERVALRTDGGLRTGRDLLVAALLGAEEFAFGTALLVSIGCDMARQCHLDTCPTGIATQRDDLRAKFAGTPEQVERFVTAIAEDLRRELAAVGARSVGEVVGEAGRYLAPVPGATHDLRPLLAAPAWSALAARRTDPPSSVETVERAPASAVEQGLVAALSSAGGVPTGPVRITNADRSVGAALAGAIERGQVAGGVTIAFAGSAGQSFGAFLPAGAGLELTGQANDYVAKGLSGGRIVIRPEPDLAGAAAGQAVAGNTCLYGATGGSVHLVGRAGMRFAVRNSGAEAVVEGIGAHGCEYMTGGVVVVLGPVGANFGAGMSGGRAYLFDPTGRHAGLLAGSVTAARLAVAARERPDGAALVAELRRLLEAHRDAGSERAAGLLAGPMPLRDVWLVEPAEALATATTPSEPDAGAARSTAAPLARG